MRCSENSKIPAVRPFHTHQIASITLTHHHKFMGAHPHTCSSPFVHNEYDLDVEIKYIGNFYHEFSVFPLYFWPVLIHSILLENVISIICLNKRLVRTVLPFGPAKGWLNQPFIMNCTHFVYKLITIFNATLKNLFNQTVVYVSIRPLPPALIL